MITPSASCPPRTPYRRADLDWMKIQTRWMMHNCGVIVHFIDHYIARGGYGVYMDAVKARSRRVDQR
jgi:hypothetical protein